MRCADCQHWTPSDQDPRFGDCASDAFIGSYDPPPYEDVPIDGAVIECDEGWMWRTGRDFGCIHFCAKAQDKPLEDHA